MTPPSPPSLSGRKRRRTPTRTQTLKSDRLEAWGLSQVQQRLLVIIGAVAGVLVAAVAIAFAISAIGNDFVPERATAAAVATQPRPDAYRGWISPKLFAPIAESKADPTPLTLKEVFAEKTLKEGRITLKLTAPKLDADCSTVVWGQELADRIAQAGCTQALRAAYLSADGRYVAQYTLLNLRDTASADGLVQSLTAAHRGSWVQVLDSAARLFPSGGHSEASGHAMGHYVGLVWIGRADGAEPGQKDDFVSLSLAVRGAEKAVFRRVVAAGSSAAPAS
ncbi:hypothetical protein [Streptosporangium carneum]|uniref:Uncharacterized protein n=1 Tax=Streptosporangium carneum TaxID=47481 RepID=A0A9W6I2N5_9ACTN|nr:hypothetical protein [Streptosporangium carneum]GLK10920.1 hypothetical protein GCM10017600_43260 [Streptosporangium carneum]